jgi:hypothetical protein
MYCDLHSVTGMVAYGNSSRLLGYRQGCPIHFPLHQDEHIVSVWLRLPDDRFGFPLHN